MVRSVYLQRKSELAEETRAEGEGDRGGEGREVPVGQGSGRERGSHPFGGFHKGDAREHRLLVIQYNSPIG